MCLFSQCLSQCENCEKITGGFKNMGRGAEGGGFGEGVSPSLTGVRPGEGAMPLPPPENFLTFWLKIVHFGIYSDKNSQFSIE